MAEQNKYGNGETREKGDYHLKGSFSNVLGKLDELRRGTDELKKKKSEREVK